MKPICSVHKLIYQHKSTVRLMSSKIDWSKHLDASSKRPSFSHDKVTFLNMRYCPYAHRTALVLEAKQIPYENINVHLMSKPQWFLDLNPLGKVPTVIIGKDVIYESIPVCQYLDDIYPGRTLSPKQPKGKARDAMFLTHFDQVIRQFYKFFKSDNHIESLKGFQGSLQFMELTLKKNDSNSPFLSTLAAPGMIDYMVWPWFERMDVISYLLPHIAADPLPPQDFPCTHLWIKAMRKDPPVKSCFLDAFHHGNFLKSLFIDGSPVYDPHLRQSSNV